MNQISPVVGIDVSKLKLDVALLVQGKVRSKVVSNNPAGYADLRAWLLKYGQVLSGLPVCMEATGPYSEPAAIALSDMGMAVSVVNPARVKGFAQSEMLRNKTDRVDAALLARFCAVMQPEPWTPPSLPHRQLRAWVERLQALKEMRQQESNRLQGHELLGEPALTRNVQQHIDWLDAQIKQLEKNIDDHIDQHPALTRDAELISTIPGVGATTAAKVLAYAGDIRRFSNAKALAAFAGVTPRQRQSGTSVRGRTTISRCGHQLLRTALYMPGLVARRRNPVLKAFGDRLQANGLAPKAVIGAVMRKLIHTIYGVVTSGKPFDPLVANKKLDFQDGI
ncbi:MAG: IS110 family transposase [Pseudomonas sp.]